MIDMVILGFLHKKDMSGYDIKQFMKISTSFFVNSSYGSIYPNLKKLEEKELIDSKQVVKNNKFKKIYSINDKGKEVFINWLNEPAEFHGKKTNHLVKIFFYNYLPKERAIELLNNYINNFTIVKNKLEGFDSEINNIADYFQMSTYIYGKKHFKFIIDWLQDVIDGLINEQNEGKLED